MARTYARVKGSVWTDEDWRSLSPEAQWAYLLLISQPQITNCGVLPYLPARWTRLAAGLTTGAVRAMLEELEHHRFVVVDEAAGEVLIRSFVKHDGVEKVPNIRQAALRQYEEIESRLIRHTLAGEYPHLFTYTGPIPTFHADQLPLAEGVREPVNERVAEPLGEGDNARVPLTFSQQPAASSPAPPPTPQEPAAAETTEDDHPLRATLEAEPIAWKPWQITRGLADHDRCQAWVDAALANSEIGNPGGFAWSKFDKGGWPDKHPGPPPTTVPLPKAWASFLAGQGWDEDFTQAAILDELDHRRRSPKTTGTLTDEQALEQWRQERERRGYPDPVEDDPGPPVGTSATTPPGGDVTKERS